MANTLHLLRTSRALRMSACFLASCAATLAFAAPEEPLSGTYSGTFDSQTRHGAQPVAVSLTIDKVEGDEVSATARLPSNGVCTGDYKLSGKYQSGHLTLASTSGNGVAGCGFRVDVTHQGNDLVGSAQKGRAMRLSK
jgi:hypothetical protein